MTTTRKTGDKAEEIAVFYLIKKGYKILHRNWYFGHNELDIVAKHNGQLVVVEVKSRTGDQYDHPSEALSNKKIRNIVEATEAYIHKNNIDEETRFDLITVIFYGQEYELEHFEDAFYPM